MQRTEKLFFYHNAFFYRLPAFPNEHGASKQRIISILHFLNRKKYFRIKFDFYWFGIFSLLAFFPIFASFREIIQLRLDVCVLRLFTMDGKIFKLHNCQTNVESNRLELEWFRIGFPIDWTTLQENSFRAARGLSTSFSQTSKSQMWITMKRFSHSSREIVFWTWKVPAVQI